MEVRKNDNSFEEYSPQKIKHGICEAYNAMKEICPDGLIESLVRNLFIYDKISSKEIRRQVEEALMSVNKKVARAYITKSEEEEGQNKTLKKDSDFIRDYINASNASTGSKYDSNANVENKNIVTLGQELHKGKNIQQNRYIMHNKIRALYSKRIADQYIKDLESHVLYKHDESGTPGYPYCVAITMYPFLVDGLKNIGGQSTAPTDLKSYCGEFINLVYSVSSQFMGAVATPEFLMYMDYFIRRDYGDDYLNILDKQVEINRKGRTLEQVIENCFHQVVHSMNMPAGNRGYQTVFWNIGYFDKNYFEGVFGEFKFPDGTKPKWETFKETKEYKMWSNIQKVLEEYNLSGNDYVTRKDIGGKFWEPLYDRIFKLGVTLKHTSKTMKGIKMDWMRPLLYLESQTQDIIIFDGDNFPINKGALANATNLRFAFKRLLDSLVKGKSLDENNFAKEFKQLKEDSKYFFKMLNNYIKLGFREMHENLKLILLPLRLLRKSAYRLFSIEQQESGNIDLNLFKDKNYLKQLTDGIKEGLKWDEFILKRDVAMEDLDQFLNKNTNPNLFEYHFNNQIIEKEKLEQDPYESLALKINEKDKTNNNNDGNNNNKKKGLTPEEKAKRGLF